MDREAEGGFQAEVTGMTGDFLLFSGTANPQLAAAMAQQLRIPMGRSDIERFPDGEVSIRLLEPVRRREVYLVQPTAPPVNDHLVELLAFADACRRSAAARVTAVVPYFGYSRSDKRHGRREPISASLVASLLQVAGVDHVITVDLHTTQIEGFFHIPVDTLTAVPTLCGAMADLLPPDTVVVSPDAGRVPLATAYAHCLGCPVAVLHKRRESGAETHITHLVGEVSGRTCLIIDDIISTGGTLVSAVEALREAGGREFVIAATHGLLLPGAIERLTAAAVGRILITDSVRGEASDLVQRVSIAPLLAAAVERTCYGAPDHS
jgi:ribose-phosphate pyrophosphokinase